MADARPARSFRRWTGPRRRRAVSLAVVGGLAAVVAVAMVRGAEYDATASVSPIATYLNDAAGSGLAFKVTNTGTTVSIGAVQIRRPDTGWGVAGCEGGPAGWSVQRADPFCRYRSADGSADDIQPGGNATFTVRATTEPGSADRIGAFHVVVSRSNQFDNPSLLTAAAEGGAGLDVTAHSFQVLDAVVADAAATPGAACPAANREALVDATKTIVVCGRNRSSVTLTPSAALSTLGGGFLASSGTFSSGAITANSSASVVLGNWTGAVVRTTGGTDLAVVARIAATATQTSPLTTLGGYTALNQPPNAADDGPFEILEDGSLTVPAPGILGNDSDPDGHPLAAALDQDASNGAATVAADGGFSYVPDPDFFGTDSFSYTVSDGHGGSAGATVTIAVAAVNDEPSFLLPATEHASSEDAGGQSVAGFATSISAGPSNESGQALTFELDADNPGLFAIAPAIDAAGTLTYLAAPDAFGSAGVSVVLRDDGGTSDGGDDTSPALAFTITVDSVNDAPSFVLPADPDQVIAEDAGPQSVPSFASSISAGPANEAGQVVTFDVSSDNPSLFSVAPAISAGGTLTYTTAPDLSGSAVVTVVARDDGGTAGGGVDSSPPQDFTITVTGVNDKPSAADQSYGTAVANTTFAVGRPSQPGPVVHATGSLLDGANDPDGPTPLQVVAGTIATTGGGTATLFADGTFTYLSAAGYDGLTDGFDYVIRDGAGGESAPAAVDIALSGDVVWYVDGTAASGGDGRSNAPYSTLAPVNGGGDVDEPGDILFVYGAAATYAGGLVLESGQELVGEPAGLTLVSQQIVAAAGTRPVLGNASGDGLTIASDVSIRSIEVAGAAGDGIAGTVGGSVAIDDVVVHGSVGDNARLSASAGFSVLTIDDTVLRDGALSGSGHGLRLVAAGTANLTAVITDGTFSRNRVAGIQALTSGAGILDITIGGGTFESNFNGVDLIHASSGRLTAVVSDNVISTSAAGGGAPINLFLSNQAGSAATSIFRATITANTISNNDSDSAPGIWYHTGSSAGHARLQISGNDVSGVGHRGIAVEAGPGSSTVDATISGNRVDLPAGGLEGIFVQSGVVSTDSVAVCADIASNAVTSPVDDIRVRQRFLGTTFRLPGYAGSGTDDAAVQAYLAGRNTVGDVLATHQSAAGFAGGGGCAVP